jgi:hypothetical protein
MCLNRTKCRHRVTHCPTPLRRTCFKCLLWSILLLASSQGVGAQKVTKPTPAKLPQQLRPTPPPLITTMAVGEEWWVDSTDMLITKKWDCYLNPKAKRYARNLSRIRVRRDRTGYHVIFVERDVGLVILDLDPKYYMHWIPVASITIVTEADKQNAR